MNLVDLMIILVAAAAITRGVRVGLLRQALSVGGFFSGLFIGSLIAPRVVVLGGDALGRSLIAVSVTMGLGLMLSAAGEYAGIRLSHWAQKFRFGGFNAALGAVFEVVAVLVSAWLLAGVVANLPFSGLAAATQQSKIIQWLDSSLPPAPAVVARLERLIDPNGFPRVFIGREPVPGKQAAPTADVQAVLDRDAASVVKLEGLGCGGVVLGSGFVAGPGIVATNAHVVAGVRRPTIIDGAGRHAATAIWFDPDMDLAVLRSDGLAGPPLALVMAVQPPGTASVVLGYPGGGPLTASGAAVLDEIRAYGRNIYGSGVSQREIYQVQAVVQPGNSGGPLVLTDGRVAGIVFAKSVENDNVGYALTAGETAPAIRQAQSRNQPVSTGRSCAEE